MFAGFTETFLKNGGQPLLYQYTKRKQKIPDNYRGISLLNTGNKIYSNIIAKRLTGIAEVLLLEEQNGFRKGRSCMDCLFSASQIIEKHREFNIPNYITFIDFKKPLILWTETNYGILCSVKEFQFI